MDLSADLLRSPRVSVSPSSWRGAAHLCIFFYNSSPTHWSRWSRPTTRAIRACLWRTRLRTPARGGCRGLSLPAGAPTGLRWPESSSLDASPPPNARHPPLLDAWIRQLPSLRQGPSSLATPPPRARLPQPAPSPGRQSLGHIGSENRK